MQCQDFADLCYNGAQLFPVLKPNLSDLHQCVMSSGGQRSDVSVDYITGAGQLWKSRQLHVNTLSTGSQLCAEKGAATQYWTGWVTQASLQLGALGIMHRVFINWTALCLFRTHVSAIWPYYTSQVLWSLGAQTSVGLGLGLACP